MDEGKVPGGRSMKDGRIGPGSVEGVSGTSGVTRLDALRPLLPAEEEVLSRLLSGSLDRLGDGTPPTSDDAARAIRAPFLRFLILGGDEGHRPHEKGVRLSGAWIQGILDLEACRVPRDIGLKDCRFDAVPVFTSAVIDRAFLDGSSLPGLQAERLDVRGGLYLRGVRVDGEIRLTDAGLGGNLVCDGAVIKSLGSFALNAEGIEVRNVLARGTDVRGGINLRGARLVADFDGTGAKVFQPDDVAIAAEAIDVGGSVLLRSATVDGEVRLLGASIAGDLNCTSMGIANPSDDALQLSRAEIGGILPAAGRQDRRSA
ncbi:hypothetical protein [Microvirga lotononidis]|nr:hypothetical protein [Microvirga lotononidis]WQO31553.1 hypothetical protein U0023_29715 [Microvirga lotononidis]